MPGASGAPGGTGLAAGDGWGHDSLCEDAVRKP
jgi:hypothetical protein